MSQPPSFAFCILDNSEGVFTSQNTFLLFLSSSTFFLVASTFYTFKENPTYFQIMEVTEQAKGNF